MGSPYPDTQFICYVVLNQDALGRLKDKNGNALNYTYISSIINQNIYARVINYYGIDENGKTPKDSGFNPNKIVKYVADIRFTGVGELDGAVVEGIEVLSTSTLVNENLFVLQAYSSNSFTIETSETAEGSDVFSNEYISTSNSDDLNIKKDYLDTITVFDVSTSQVSYYSIDNGDYVHLAVLTPEQYQAYLYAKAIESLDTTALHVVLTSYNINISKLDPDSTLCDAQGYFNISGVKDGYYVFMFYYNHNTTSSIVSVCDTFIRKQEVSGGNYVLKYYPTSNNVAFTQSSVSVSTTENENETRFIISTATMKTAFVDYNKTVYESSELKLAIITPNVLKQYISAYHTQGDRESAFESILGSCTLVNNSHTATVSANVYVIGYYQNDSDKIVKVTPNYVYINNDLHTASIIYDQDLMFVDINGLSSNRAENSFGITIDDADVSTIKYDYLNNTLYNTDDFDLYFVAFTGEQFKLLTDYVTNGFMSMTEALTHIFTANNTYSIRSKFAGTSCTLSGFEYNKNYYIIAYYANKTGTNAINKALIASVNMIIISDKKDADGNHLFKASISTMSNDFSFAIEALDINKTSASVSVINEYMNTVYNNYVTGSSFDMTTLKYLLVSQDELETIYDYYTNGFSITYGSKSRTFNNLTFEQAVELVIYYYRNDKAGKNIDNLRGQLVGVNDLDYILTNTPLETPVYQSTYAFSAYGDGATYTYYMIAINAAGSSSLFNKVASNFVKFDMVSEKNGDVTTVTTLDATLITFDNYFDQLSQA